MTIDQLPLLFDWDDFEEAVRTGRFSTIRDAKIFVAKVLGLDAKINHDVWRQIKGGMFPEERKMLTGLPPYDFGKYEAERMRRLAEFGQDPPPRPDPTSKCSHCDTPLNDENIALRIRKPYAIWQCLNCERIRSRNRRAANRNQKAST